MADLAAQLALPRDFGWRQPSSVAAPSATEKGAAAETATGTAAVRAARFRALFRPLAEEERDAARKGSPKDEARTLPASGDAPPPLNAQPPAPAAAPPAPVSLEPDFTSQTVVSADLQPAPDGSEAASASLNDAWQPLREAGARSAWGAVAAGTAQPEAPPPLNPDSAGQLRTSGVGASASGGNDPLTSWRGPAQEPAAQDRPAAAAAPAGLASSAPDSAGQPVASGVAETRATGSLPPPEPRKQPLETSLAALFPAALSAPAATAAPRRIEELGPPAAEVSPAAAGRVSGVGEGFTTPPSPSGREDGTGAPAARGELAFAGRLIQASWASSQAAAPASSQGRGGNAAGSNGERPARPAGPAETAGGAADSPAGTAAGDRAGNPEGGTGGSSASKPPSGGETERAPAERIHEPASASRPQAAEPPGGAAVPVADSSPRQDARRSEASGGAPAQPLAASAGRATETAAPGPARDITLSLDNGLQRVAVHLQERGGEVRVAVRTPDPALAGDLRRALPSLTAKLEQTGFRTETWHSEAAPRRSAEAAARGASEDPAGQSRQDGRERREGQPQPRENQQRPDRKKERKDFAWFMSSLG